MGLMSKIGENKRFYGRIQYAGSNGMYSPFDFGLVFWRRLIDVFPPPPLNRVVDIAVRCMYILNLLHPKSPSNHHESISPYQSCHRFYCIVPRPKQVAIQQENSANSQFRFRLADDFTYPVVQCIAAIHTDISCFWKKFATYDLFFVSCKPNSERS